MKLGLLVGYSPATLSMPMDLIKEAETLGFSSVWTAEAWGSDAVTPAAWVLAAPMACVHCAGVKPRNLLAPAAAPSVPTVAVACHPLS